jgi:prolyl oligopeptidase
MYYRIVIKLQGDKMKRKGRIFSIEEIISIKGIGVPVISKNGNKVAYQVTSTDWKEDCYVKELWLYDVLSNKHEQIVGKHEDYMGSAKWSPDGKLLAMLLKTGGKKDGTNQIYVIDIDSMEKNQISYHEKGVKDYIWSPDSKGFYYVSTSPNAKKKEERDKKYGKFTYIDEDKTNNCLFYLEFKKGLEVTESRYQLPKDLNIKSKKDKKNTYYPSVLLSEEKNFYMHQIIASPDGSKLALTVAPSPTMEDYDDLTLYLYDVKAKKFEEIKIEHFDGNVLFSPDSNKLCLSRQESWLNNNELVIYNLKTKKLSKIKTNIDEVVYITQWTEEGMVLFNQDKTASKYSLFNENKEIVPILCKADIYYQGLNYTNDGKYMVYLERDRKNLSELYVNSRKVSNRSAALKGRKIAEKKMISWKNSDDFEIEGVLSTQKDFDENKKYPLLVIIHGGPTGTSYPFAISDRLYPIETFVEQGFITIEPNYRGSAGYGDKFRSSNFKNLGVGDYDDIISGVDHLIDLGYVDKDKIGVMGWSQGGYISAFCTTFSDRFKSISVGAGISNWETYYYNTDIPKFTKEYLDDVPFKDKTIYEKTSPMTHINNAKTPTLIQHGSADARVPVANAQELYRALKELKLEPKMVIFENMGHGPSTPGIVRAINRQNLNWFCHHLLSQPLEDYYLHSDDDK